MANENGKPQDPTAAPAGQPAKLAQVDPLDKYVIVKWPWGEAEDRWFEALTGEPCNDGATRDADL